MTPKVFPFKASQLRTMLDFIVLQSRFWSLKASAEGGEDINRTFRRYKEAAGVEKPDTWLSAIVYRDARKFVAGEVSSTSWLGAIRDEVEKIDDWLLNSHPGAAAECRKFTLSYVANGIYNYRDRMVLDASAIDIPGVEAFASRGVHDLLRRFVHFIESDGPFHLARYLQSFKAVVRLWKVKRTEGPADGDPGDSGPELVQPEDPRPEFVYPDSMQHPLADLVIYRAILIVMSLSLGFDNSDFMTEDLYNQVIPFL